MARRALAEMVLIDMERQWDQGHSPSARHYLDTYPQLKALNWLADELGSAERAARDRRCLDSDIRRPVPGRKSAAADGESQWIDWFSAPANVRADVDAEVRGPEGLPGQTRGVDLHDCDADGRFELIREVGRGTVGRVWVAKDRKLNCRVAIKICNTAGSGQQSAEIEGRVYREACIAARLGTHRNICAVRDIRRSDDALYLCMEFVDGETLRAQLARTGAIDQRAAALLVRKIAVTLDYAHANLVVHRDLKPETS